MAIAIFCFVDLPSNRLSLSLTVSYLALHVFNLLYDSFSVSFISCYLKDTGTVLTHSPLTAATRVRYQASACEVVTKSDRWVSSGHSGFLPQEDHPNANIGANEHDVS